MGLQAEKIELVKLLLEVEDEQILSEVKAILTDEHVFYEELPEYVKEGINRSLKQMKNGELQDHESVMKEMKDKYGI